MKRNIEVKNREQELIDRLNANTDKNRYTASVDTAKGTDSGDTIFWNDEWNEGLEKNPYEGNEEWKNDYFDNKKVEPLCVDLSVRDYNGQIIEDLQDYEYSADDVAESRASSEKPTVDFRTAMGKVREDLELKRLKKDPIKISAMKKALGLNEDTQSRTYEEVNHPQHYNNYDVEVIDMMERIFGKEETAIFCKLNAFKYRMRAGTKPNQSAEKDLAKEQWYLDKKKELESVK